jgi:hypothetical protein
LRRINFRGYYDCAAHFATSEAGCDATRLTVRWRRLLHFLVRSISVQKWTDAGALIAFNSSVLLPAFCCRSPGTLAGLSFEVPTHPSATSAAEQLVLQAKSGRKYGFGDEEMKMNRARNEREIVETFQYLKCLATLVGNSK